MMTAGQKSLYRAMIELYQSRNSATMTGEHIENITAAMRATEKLLTDMSLAGQSLYALRNSFDAEQANSPALPEAVIDVLSFWNAYLSNVFDGSMFWRVRVKNGEFIYSLYRRVRIAGTSLTLFELEQAFIPEFNNLKTAYVFMRDISRAVVHNQR